MNERNWFIARYNQRKLYPLVDDKLKTKLLAEQRGLAVPKLYGVVREQHEVETMGELLAKYDSFVIKPSRGSGGKGIKVIVGKRDDVFIKSSGDEVTHLDVTRHVSNILSGLYSLGGKPDVAMIEALVEMDPQFNGLSYEGIPDIRIIVFMGYPVMSMMRLATHASDGKANLHQGAVGVGLDLATGRSLFAVQYNRPLELHPDTGLPLNTLTIPHWHELMCLGASCYEITGLGYLGCRHRDGPQPRPADHGTERAPGARDPDRQQHRAVAAHPPHRARGGGEPAAPGRGARAIQHERLRHGTRPGQRRSERSGGARLRHRRVHRQPRRPGGFRYEPPVCALHSPWRACNCPQPRCSRRRLRRLQPDQPAGSGGLNCIPLKRIQNTRVLDDRHDPVRDDRQRNARQSPAAPLSPGWDSKRVSATRPASASCAARTSSGWSPRMGSGLDRGASCGLGRFEPYVAPETDAADKGKLEPM